MKMRFVIITISIFNSGAFGQDLDLRLTRPDWVFTMGNFAQEYKPKKPDALVLPPLSPSDNFNAFQTKYTTFQGNIILEQLKGESKTIRMVDDFAKNPPKIKVLAIESAVYYDFNSAQIIAKSEYGNTILKESFSLAENKTELEFAHFLEAKKISKFGYRWTSNYNENRHVGFIEKSF